MTSLATPSEGGRPEATSLSLQELIEQASAGLLRVPEWQRLFKWSPAQIGELLDSIALGYPVGLLLLWKRPDPAPAGRFELGPHWIDARESSEARWVIDGRQRVTALFGALARRGPPERSPDARDAFSWAFDLSTEKWVQPRPRDAWKGTWLPADRMVDASDLLAWLLAHQDGLTPAQQQRANKLSRDIREYRIPAIVVKSSRDETLRVIFDRTNTKGKKLKTNEIFDALHGALAGPTPSSIRALAEVSRQEGFGEFDKDWLLRLVVQVAGGDMTNMSHSTLEDRALLATLPTAATALRRTLVFVRRELGIQHEAFLPYRLPLVVLSVFFSRHAEPRPRTLDLLGRWFWRGVENGQHRGQDIGKVRETFRAIDGDEEASVQRLLRDLGGQGTLPWQPRPLRMQSATTKVELLAMASLRPRHLETGEPLEVVSLVVEQGSKAILRLFEPLTVVTRRHSSEWSNRLLHPPITKKSLIAKLLLAPPQVIASHAIPMEALEALKHHDIEGFLRHRAILLNALFSRFLASRTRWGESTRPSLRELLVEDSA